MCGKTINKSPIFNDTSKDYLFLHIPHVNAAILTPWVQKYMSFNLAWASSSFFLKSLVCSVSAFSCSFSANSCCLSIFSCRFSARYLSFSLAISSICFCHRFICACEDLNSRLYRYPSTRSDVNLHLNIHLKDMSNLDSNNEWKRLKTNVHIDIAIVYFDVKRVGNFDYSAYLTISPIFFSRAQNNKQNCRLLPI